MGKSVTFLMLTVIALQACTPNEPFSTQTLNPDDIHTVSTNITLFVPPQCKDAGVHIYEELRLEKFRSRYVSDTLQALVNLSICLDETGYAKEATEIGFETLLLSEATLKTPYDLEFVAEIVSDSRWHTYAERSWAHWTLTSEAENNRDDLRIAPQSGSRVRNLMIKNKNIALANYFNQFQNLRND